ncbi:MAG TPA: SDR family oxidoreductase [Bacilli bacterium]|nr:SDR family oxidoreductase [Bacilli bacterium]
MLLKDKVAIITGAASGIGKAIAELFSVEGATVIVADLTQEAGEEVVKSITSKGGVAKFIQVDVSNEAQVNRLVEETINEFGKIDIMYNNAGIAMPLSNIEEVDEALYEKMMSINMKGVFLGTKAVAPYMKKAGKGVILSTASTAAVRPRAGLNIYSASKGAVVAFSKSVALELAPYGIRVNCINPSATNTPMLEEEHLKVFIKTMPLGKIAEPLDIAQAALFLASDYASMVTGVDFNVDGGRSV